MLKIKTILLLTLFSSPFMFTLKAQADLFGDYVASETKEVDQRRTVGSGSRSSCQSNIVKNSVSLLVPKQKVVHHTSLQKPSFFLVANRGVTSDKPFKFTLVDPQTARTLVEKTFSISGEIEQIELPKSTKLQSGKIYLWYVAIPCTNNKDEYREVLGAAIRRRNLTRNVKIQLNRAKSNIQTAAIYARNGFWYEALEIAVEEQIREQNDGKVRRLSYLARLLHSAELNFSDTTIHQKSK